MMDADISIHRMMSQGVSASVAKVLSNFEMKYDEAFAKLETTFQTKINELCMEAEDQFRIHSYEILTLKNELLSSKRELQQLQKETLELKRQNEIFRRLESNEEIQCKQYDEINRNMRSLTGTAKTILEKVVHHQELIHVLQDDSKNFSKRLDCRNRMADSIITRHENAFKTIRDKLEVHEQNIHLSAQDVSFLKTVYYQKMDNLQSKVDKYVKEKLYHTKESISKVHITVDEHNQLRSDLEDQILESNMKCDYTVLTMQQKLDETKQRLDELEVVTKIAERVRKRRDYTTKNSSLKIDALHQIKEEQNENEIEANLDVENNIPNLPSLMQENGIKEKEEIENIDEPSTVAKSNTYVLKCNSYDDDSAFGSMISLVLLGEHNIQP